ncbi:MAG: isochorismate synthase [Bacteroidota bacterium]
MTDPATLYTKIQLQLQQCLPFVAYRNPESTALNLLFQQDHTLHTIKDYTERGFIVAPFHQDQDTLLIPYKHHISCPDEQYATDSPNPAIPQYPKSDRDAHLQLIAKGIAAIKKGRFKKVVLSRATTVNISHLNVIQVYKKLLTAYPTAFCYLWFHPQTGLWMGATPETLLTLKDNHLETMALAGTQKFKGTLHPIWSEKEKEEQRLVTRFIVDSLRPVVHDTEVSRVHTIRAGNLLHLRTRITATLPNAKCNIQHIINVLHPTPAVCGYPREAAKQFIIAHENYNRHLYTGFLGTLNVSDTNTQDTQKQSSIYVNLRCMKISDHKATVYTGGGITAASIPEHEWQETLNKAQTMLKVLPG